MNNIKNLHEMIFVYNAVCDGWTVRKLSNGKLRFKKKNSNPHLKSINEYDLDLANFVSTNTQIDNIFNNQ